MVNWKIDSMVVRPKTDLHTNVVYKVNWTATAIDGINSAGTSGSIELSEPSEGFIPYFDLTENQVVEWVKNTIGADAITQIENNLNSQLIYMSNPPLVLAPLPWSNLLP